MVDTTRTRLDLVNEALGILTNLPVSTGFNDEEQATVDYYVDPVLAELAADEVVYVADADEIPIEFFLNIAGILASRCGPRFGAARDLNGEERLKQAIKKIESRKPTYETLDPEYM